MQLGSCIRQNADLGSRIRQNAGSPRFCKRGYLVLPCFRENRKSILSEFRWSSISLVWPADRYHEEHLVRVDPIGEPECLKQIEGV